MTIIKIWIAAIWLGAAAVIIGVVIPALINMHNDGALLLAPILALAVGTAAWATYSKVFKDDSNEDA